ncbi:MAG: hypothetical protein V3W14_01315 [Candidatus Neomarinimicrobiota bacterium]
MAGDYEFEMKDSPSEPERIDFWNSTALLKNAHLVYEIAGNIADGFGNDTMKLLDISL